MNTPAQYPPAVSSAGLPGGNASGALPVITAAAVSQSAFELLPPDLGKWREGNEDVEGVWHFDSGLPGKHVMLTALVHGNELCGAWALKGLLEAELRPQHGRLTLAFCNLEAFDRFNPANPDAARFVDEDLNRQWSDARINVGDSSERRRAAQLRPYVARADWLLDSHENPGAGQRIRRRHHDAVGHGRGRSPRRLRPRA